MGTCSFMCRVTDRLELRNALHVLDFHPLDDVKMMVHVIAILNMISSVTCHVELHSALSFVLLMYLFTK